MRRELKYLIQTVLDAWPLGKFLVCIYCIIPLLTKKSIIFPFFNLSTDQTNSCRLTNESMTIILKYVFNLFHLFFFPTII